MHAQAPCRLQWTVCTLTGPPSIHSEREAHKRSDRTQLSRGLFSVPLRGKVFIFPEDSATASVPDPQGEQAAEEQCPAPERLPDPTLLPPPLLHLQVQGPRRTAPAVHWACVLTVKGPCLPRPQSMPGPAGCLPPGLQNPGGWEAPAEEGCEKGVVRGQRQDCPGTRAGFCWETLGHKTTLCW